MTLYKKREKMKTLKEFGELVGKTFATFGLSPNQWTCVVLIPAFLAAYFILQQQFVLGGLFILISGFVDLIDGAVARKLGKVTKLGAYLDTMVDRYVEFLFVLPLTLIALPSAFSLPAAFWLFLYLFGGIITTYSKAAAKEKELVTEELKGGILERAERIIILTVGIFVAAVSLTYLVYVIVLLAILSNISALQRIQAAIETQRI